MASMNQCDGCMRKLRVNERGTHVEDSRPVMSCTASRYSSPTASTKNNNPVTGFIPSSTKIYAIFHIDTHGESLVPPLWKSEKRAHARKSGLEKRTGEVYYVAELELRE